MVRKLSQEKDYDLIHLILPGLNPFFTRMATKKRNTIIKHIFIYPFHSDFSTERLAYNFFQKSSALKLLNVNLAFSSRILQKIYNAEAATILPPAIDTNFYRPKPKPNYSHKVLMESTSKIGSASNVLQKDVVLLHIGPLLHERFDLKTVIGGFMRLRKEYGVDAGLTIVGRKRGSAPYFWEIKNHVYKNNLGDCVFTCVKDLSDSEKIGLFNDSHVFIYPFPRKLRHMSVVFPPIALLESMSTGSCMVSGGLPYLMLGLLPDSPEHLYIQISSVEQNDWMSDSQSHVLQALKQCLLNQITSMP